MEFMAPTASLQPAPMSLRRVRRVGGYGVGYALLLERAAGGGGLFRFCSDAVQSLLPLRTLVTWAGARQAYRLSKPLGPLASLS